MMHDHDLENPDDCVRIITDLEDKVTAREDTILGWVNDYSDLEKLMDDERAEWVRQENDLARQLESLRDLLIDLRYRINDTL